MKKTVSDIDVAGARCLVRVDFNVPFEPGTTTISDDSRIRAALPTINYLRERGARVILATHVGRPKGMVDDSLRVAPMAARLAELISVSRHQSRPILSAKRLKGWLPRLAPAMSSSLKTPGSTSEEEKERT